MEFYFELKGAAGCQADIAAKIVAEKADYLLALKGNQPTLEADVADYFHAAPADELITKTTVEKGHGRIETAALAWTKAVMTKLGLTLNEARTSVRNARKESFDFLGYNAGAPPFSYRWPVVPGGKPIQEERATSEAEAPRSAPNVPASGRAQ